jgi:DNA-binding transcriptional LysR family regulator
MEPNKNVAKTGKRTVPADWYLRSRLKMRHLRLMIAIDEHRNMHKASAALGMTQPAATRLLKDLERLLGLVLFDRTTRGIAPNAYGDSLIRHARSMLATLEHARDELNALAEGASGKIVVGVLQVAATVLVPRAVAAFKRLHPRHTILIREDTSANLVQALLRGEIDLLVGRASGDVQADGLQFEPFYDEPMCVVARPGHPFARRGRLALGALSRASWIVPPPEAFYRRRFDAAFRQAGVEPPRNIVESLSILSNKTLLQETDMLGVMPREVARHYAKLGILTLIKVDVPPPSGPVGIVSASGRPTSLATSDFLAALRNEAARLQ